MNFLERKNKSGEKIFFYYDFGREKGQRPSTGIFIYAKPKNQIEKNHNKEAQALLATKKSQLTLEKQSLGSGFIPSLRSNQTFLTTTRIMLIRIKEKEIVIWKTALLNSKLF